MRRRLFISDLHLSVRRMDTIDLFLRFLRERASEADELYILGDLFDTWIGDGDNAPPTPRIRDALRATVDSGCQVFVQHGNRDFLLGKTFAQQTGVTLIPEEYVIEHNGQIALLMHGDLLCTDDLDYQRARRLLRNRLFLGIMSCLPFKARAWVASCFRQRSALVVSRKPREIMDVNTETVTAYLRKYHADLLIHGHTHRPNVHESTVDGRTVRRFVLGEWHADSTLYLSADPSGFRMEQFP